MKMIEVIQNLGIKETVEAIKLSLWVLRILTMLWMKYKKNK